MHHTLEQWADFARNIVPTEAATKMQQHLDGGCEPCREALATIKSVAELSAREASYEPPANAVRMSKLLGRTDLPKATENRLPQIWPLVFDSFAQPAMAGVRVALTSSRQLLYRKGDCCIDIRLEHASGAKDISLIGQVLDSGQAGRGVNAILVELMSGEKAIGGTATNTFGEFQFLFPVADHLQLCFGISSQNCFWIKIPPLETIPESGLVVND